MDEVFRVTDRWGREIVLTRAQWTMHILVRHADVAGRSSLIASAVTSPVLVSYDRTFFDREVFYGSVPPYPLSRRLMRVVVEFGTRGEVVTAHFIEKPHRKEVRKWP